MAHDQARRREGRCHGSEGEAESHSGEGPTTEGEAAQPVPRAGASAE